MDHPEYGQAGDNMDLQLKDKTAMVTGASVGIGRGIALALAATFQRPGALTEASV
jgi:5,10-methylene-tetrahydrofolate dehydrogenase/methenyl tetrahydrofolate cyclohydrolase